MIIAKRKARQIIFDNQYEREWFGVWFLNAPFHGRIVSRADMNTQHQCQRRCAELQRLVMSNETLMGDLGISTQ